MRNLAQSKKRFVIALAIIGVVDLALGGYLLWPGSRPSVLQSELADLQSQNRALSREVGPLQGIPEKLEQTRKDIDTMYRVGIPRRSSQISQELDKLTRETGVTAQSIRYNPVKPEKADLPGVQRISIETTVTGDYGKVARFINALEQDDLLFVIDQISLSGENTGGTAVGNVSLQIKFITYLKEGA